MSQLGALLKVYARQNWRTMLSAFGRGSKRQVWAILLLLLVVVGFTPLVGMISANYFMVYQMGAQAGQGELVLTMAILAGMVVTLFFGFFQVISAFYYSKDSSLLVPMPIPARTILIAKFVSVMVPEYLTLLVVLAPALLIYGVLAAPGLLYWPIALIIFLLTPVLPLVVASLLAFVLMRVTNLRRSRDFFRLVGGTIGLVVALTFNRFVTRAANNPGALVSALAQQGGLIELIGHRVPPAIWATKALGASFGLGTNLLYLLLFLVAVAVGVGALAWTGDLLFWGGLIGSGEGARRGAKLSQAALQQSVGQQRSALWALVVREAKLLFRTPIYVLNSVIPLVVLPFILIPSLNQGLGAAGAKLSAMAGSPIAAAVAVAFLCFLNASGNIAATAVSREGRYLWIGQTAPIPARTHALAKLLFANLFGLLPIAILIGLGVYTKVLVGGNLVWFVLIGLLAICAMNGAGLTVDLIRPLLKWEDPQRAIKQNMNGLLGLLIGLGGAAVAGGGGAVLSIFLPSLALPILTVIFAGAAVGMTTLCLITADARWGTYED